MQNSYSQFSKISFDEFYKNKLSSSIEKFDTVRQKLKHFIRFIMLGVLILWASLFGLSSYFGNFDIVFITSVVLFFTITFFLTKRLKGRLWDYKVMEAIGYFLFNSAAFTMSISLNDQDFTKGALFFAVMTISFNAGVVVFFLSKQFLNYTYQYQELVLRPLIEHTVANVQYSPGKMVSQKTFIDSEIIRRFSDYDGNNLIEIKRGHMDVKFSNLSMTDHAYEKPKSHDFVFLTSNLRKTLTGTTTISFNRLSHFGKIGNFISDFSNMDSLPVEKDNLKFEKYFKVYSTYPPDAKGLLTQAFQERLLRLIDDFGVIYPDLFFFKMKFENQKLYMAFFITAGDSRKLFVTPKMTGKTNYSETSHTNYVHLTTVANIINALYQSDIEWTRQTELS